MGLQSNVSNWGGGTGNRERQWSDVAHLRIIWHPEEAEEVGSGCDCWYCLFCVSTGEPTGHIRRTQRAVLLLILAGQSDVHLKLSIIPNCMLPVVIVQVVQIVYFYFGVFD